MVYEVYANLRLGNAAERTQGALCTLSCVCHTISDVGRRRDKHVQVSNLVSSVNSKNFDSLYYDDTLTEAYSTFNNHAKGESESLGRVKAKLSAEENDVRVCHYLVIFAVYTHWTFRRLAENRTQVS